MHTIAKRIFIALLGLSAWAAHAQPATVSPTSDVRGNGKGRIAPTSLSLPVGVSSQIDFRCDGGARPAVANSAPEIAAMTVTGSQITITGLREGKTSITLTCDAVEAATVPVTVTADSRSR